MKPGKLMANEKGQALIVVLILLLLGSLTIVPLLNYMATGVNVGREVYKKQTAETYAADAGIEDALWYIKFGRLQSLFTDPIYDEFDYATEWDYDLPGEINNQPVNVTMGNVWIPKNITSPSKVQARTIIATGKLIVSGTALLSGSDYKIKVYYYPDPGDDTLAAESLGIWLPLGFSYVEGSSNLEADSEDPYYSVPVVEPYAGGQSIVWSFNSVPFDVFPGVDPQSEPLESEITFQFNTSKLGCTPETVSWITTSGVSDIPFSWDADTKVYHITSAAGGAEIDAYSVKSEFRKLGSAIAGDYRATGNSLMLDLEWDWGGPKRDTLLTESDAEVNDIPTDSGVAVAAFLYWSGWFEEGDITTIFSDTCSNFDNWDRYGSSGNPTRVPTADGDISGAWNTSPCWDDVDETTPSDSDYMTGTTYGGGYKLFSFSPFSIPAGSTITDLTVYVRARDVSGGYNNIRPSIKVNGTRYNTTATSNNPGTSFTTYSYSYNTNPSTGSEWTAEDLNGTGSHPLQQFGVYSSDLNPAIRVSMVYAQVNYGDSRWSIVSNEFQGWGSSSATTEEKTLTLKNSLDLSSYASGTVSVSWDQDESGSLESEDTLYFAVSSDGGNTWSDDMEAFHNDNPDSPFRYTVPDEYLTNNFKIRFYFNFDETDEYVYLDDIQVVETILEPDTSVTFKIDGTQVYFDGDGLPQQGAQEIIADQSQVINNQDYGDPEGYSYACFKDVTDLIQEFSAEGDNENYPGNGTYTVGSVSADTGSEWSYAGWSLMIIFSSAETEGRQLYLYDDFLYCSSGMNLDFDSDGQPGGTLTGFLVPDPIAGEVDAATLTCFVTEGDDYYNGDWLKFNETKLWDGTESESWDDVWNGQSIGMSADGVDIDTFHVTWESGLLEPGDSSAQIDIYTPMDVWELVYVILAVRSETTTGGTVHYLISD